MTSRNNGLILGAVAYDPKVVTIWDGFRRWFAVRGFPMTYVLYAHYEHQVEDLMAGHIDIAWNSPLAWLRSERMAKAQGANVQPLIMRDSDCDLTSAIVVRADSGIETIEDLRGMVVGTGAIDSPQATLLPLNHLRESGLLPGSNFAVKRFDVGVGLHGDHVGGEREAAQALMAGTVDAACMLDANHLAFSRDGTLPASATRVLAQTALFDHCMMTSGPSASAESLRKLTDLLLSMSYSDSEARPLLDMEGLKAWVPGRTSGYGPLAAATDALRFYDAQGNIVAADYRP
jgi:ABC-type phosphate/phosphonate transport system substrate-binding protein